MKFHLLASGSKGNACIIESRLSKIMIDVGSTQRYLKTRFLEMGFKRDDLDAVLLTHDHSDHIAQLNSFKHLPIYAPFELNNGGERTVVVPYEIFRINELTILPIALSHDREMTVAYIIDDGQQKLVYLTDTGYVRNQDLIHLTNADYYIIEANYDPELLMLTSRPYPLKQRILSDRGHLSNDDCGWILRQVIGDRTQEIVLAHLSEEANTPEIALSCVRSYVDTTQYQGSIVAAVQFDVVSGGRHD